ncbi:hypothetical protein [Actinopolymorpha pittospori]
MKRVVLATLRGAAAGAAGTTALNVVSYVDMVTRARPASTTPETTIETFSRRSHIPIPGTDGARANRVAALAPLTGIAAGVGFGALLGLLRGTRWHSGRVVTMAAATAGVMVATNTPMTALGVTDPRTWAATDWVADVLPHLAYAAVTVAVLDGLDGDNSLNAAERRHWLAPLSRVLGGRLARS